MNRMRRIGLVVLAITVATTLHAREFRFQYAEGEQYRILSTVDEEVYVNGVFSHRADILNRIAITVSGVENRRGSIEAEFETSERSVGQTGAYEWAESYESRFSRGPLGKFEIDEQYFMPVVRNVPLFPERDLEPGSTWAAEGEEVHDFRANFGVPAAYRFPVQVSYTYLGTEERNDRVYDKISIEYTVFHKAEPKYGINLYPVRIAGYSSQILYWDNRVGRPVSYEEEFDFVFTLSTGDTVEYIGTAEAEVVEATRMNRVEIADEIRRKIEDKKLPDTEVTVDEEGVTVSLQNIRFMPDSAELLTSEKKKLDAIAEILSEYPDRDILISGHTALAGTAAGRQRLSEERAGSVAEYLLSIGARTRDRIITRGMGARKPIADNNTEEGMRKNRRVEITIREN